MNTPKQNLEPKFNKQVRQNQQASNQEMNRTFKTLRISNVLSRYPATPPTSVLNAGYFSR